MAKFRTAIYVHTKTTVTINVPGLAKIELVQMVRNPDVTSDVAYLAAHWKTLEPGRTTVECDDMVFGWTSDEMAEITLAPTVHVAMAEMGKDPWPVPPPPPPPSFLKDLNTIWPKHRECFLVGIGGEGVATTRGA